VEYNYEVLNYAVFSGLMSLAASLSEVQLLSSKLRFQNYSIHILPLGRETKLNIELNSIKLTELTTSVKAWNEYERNQRRN
jgi:hypothetical protein